MSQTHALAQFYQKDLEELKLRNTRSTSSTNARERACHQKDLALVCVRVCVFMSSIVTCHLLHILKYHSLPSPTVLQHHPLHQQAKQGVATAPPSCGDACVPPAGPNKQATDKRSIGLASGPSTSSIAAVFATHRLHILPGIEHFQKHLRLQGQWPPQVRMMQRLALGLAAFAEVGMHHHGAIPALLVVEEPAQTRCSSRHNSTWLLLLVVSWLLSSASAAIHLV